jgi:microcystin-dependent protein
MLNKIDFETGQIVRRNFLKEVQKGSNFSSPPREGYYGEPTDSEHASWAIGSRDKLKDWEVADPGSEPQSVLGRMAYDGIVLGFNTDNDLVTFGPPALVSTEAGNAVRVERGSAILSTGAKVSWERQLVQLVGSTQVNYVYLSEEAALEKIANNESVLLSIAPTLPSVTTPHIPLAKLTLNANGDALLLGTENYPDTVVGHGYVDLRPSTYIGNLNTYPRNLVNTSIIGESLQISTWDRAIVDTSNGSLVITLPDSPEDSDRVAIADISGTFDRYPVIIRLPESENVVKINGSIDDWVVNVRDSHLELYFHEETSQWKFEESPGGDCNPVLGTFLSCGGKEYVGERLPEQCPDGQSIPAVYPNPSEGVYEYELGTGKCYKNYSQTVAIYSNGQGGLLTVLGAQRCDRAGTAGSGIITRPRNVIYVDQTIGDDSISNSGVDPERPFRTPERAIVEAVRESRREGGYNDRYDKIVIELAPGDYYVDNSPGSGGTSILTDEEGLIQRVPIGLTVLNSIQGNKATVIEVQTNDTSTTPPSLLNLGRVLYSESGGVGNISKLSKTSSSSSVWKVTLEYVNGTFNSGDELFYDNLSIVNPIGGGVIVPRGISINGIDLRKVRVRPMYVPTLSSGAKTSIWKVTGGSYVSLQTFTDNLQYFRTHNTVTTVTFASQEELFGGGGVASYYTKINSLFAVKEGWGSDGLESVGAEYTIVAPAPLSYNLRHQDNEENQTGAPGGDSRPNPPVSLPGATRILSSGSETPAVLPDVNSTRSSSPYVFNCSVRSIFGLNGLHADGGIVNGLKSMVTANFTQVSLQTDPNCYEDGSYLLDPPSSETSGGKRFKISSTDPFKYRHVGFRGSNNAVIQIVSCFVIGSADHFVSDSGGDLSITNSCSDFGDISLKAIGYKTYSFSQDEGAPRTGYTGTRVVQVIPPKPLSSAMEDVEVSTGLTIDYSLTEGYLDDNKVGTSAPSSYRVYIAGRDNINNPPSASLMGYGQFSYTKPDSDTGGYLLSGGESHPERRRIYLSGFDESANSVNYVANITLASSSSPGFSNLDEKSKIFSWDETAGGGRWYVTVNTSGITNTTTPNNDGFLTKKLEDAFKYKLQNSNSPLADVQFIINGSPIRMIRGVDNRTNDERVYRVILEGFSKDKGIRRPQPYYILEKQAGVTGGNLNQGATLGDNPLTVTSIRTLAEVLGADNTDPEYDGKYVTYLVQSEESRRAFEDSLYPTLDYDEPELTEDPEDSITKVALVAMNARSGVWLSSDVAPNEDRINIKTSSSVSTLGILIGLRRPSIIRASGHTWEWAGYLNYDTALPPFQNNPLDEKFALSKLIDEVAGGKVYASGMNEEGNYFIGTTVFDLRSGEQFAIPFKKGLSDAAVSNQVFSNVAIRSSLLLKDESSILFGKGTNIFFSNTTRFKSLTTGDISVNGAALPQVYATGGRAGLVQLAKTSDIRGAFGTALGISNKVVVTAAQLVRELTTRLSGVIQAGVGIEVTTEQVNPPEGDPESSSDDIYQYTVNVNPGYGGFTPIGGIIMWSGTTTEINSLINWKLCDGTNGTPDLRGKFIVGASVSKGATRPVGGYAVEDEGGSRDAIVPSHSHTAVGTSTFVGAQPSTHSLQQGNTAGLGIQQGNEADEFYATPSVSPAGTVSTQVTVNPTGVGTTNANLPPYFALAYIMRVS